jgi:hypothetical protein
MRPYLDGYVRAVSIYSSVLITAAMLFVVPSYAATLASKGALNVPSDTRVMVISTDTLLQEVLSEDFSVARRKKAAGAPKTLTLTVDFVQRVLQPGLSPMELAPGVPNAAGLLKEAGYVPPLTEQTGQPLTGDAAEYMAQGNPQMSNHQGAYGIPQQNPMTATLNSLNGYPGGPPIAPDPRDPRNRPVMPPDYLQSDNGRLYDTALIAHAVLSDGQGELTVVAVAHPGEDLHDVKKQLAERIANVVLH